jgi:hypothetical protein
VRLISGNRVTYKCEPPLDTIISFSRRSNRFIFLRVDVSPSKSNQNAFRNDYAVAFIVATQFDDFRGTEWSGKLNEFAHPDEMANWEKDGNGPDLLGMSQEED